MGKRIQKTWCYLILIFIFQWSCIKSEQEINSIIVREIVILRDEISQRSSVDSVVLELKYSSSTSIYGAKVLWEDKYLHTLQTSITNAPWSNMAIIHFKILDQFLLNDQKKPGSIKEELKSKLRIQLFDSANKDPREATLMDNSKISISHFVMGE
jgi:hypothetical protein